MDEGIASEPSPRVAAAGQSLNDAHILDAAP
jgi:hypothetical protein